MEQKFSKKVLTNSRQVRQSLIYRHETQSSILVREYLDRIPVDLLFDIFLRVPSKSLVRFRCVSKLWASILRSPDFTDLFLKMSETRPRLLFTFKVKGKLLFFSSPQPQNLNENLTLVATPYHTTGCLSSPYPEDPLGGFLCLEKDQRKDITRVICNPVTGETILLPILKGKNIKTYFGYDPIGNKFKVLCMFYSRFNRLNTHRVLTLEAGKHKWRRIECKPHSSMDSGICINGILYYQAKFEGSNIIVCFDIRYEIFDFITMPEDMSDTSFSLTLINYNGKLGARNHFLGLNEEEITLWVLEDAGKYKWSKLVFVRPFSWRHIIDQNDLYSFGMISTGEIVFSPCFLSIPFYVYYYNFERNTFTRVNIQGFEEFKHLTIRTIGIFLDYVENMNLII